MYLHKLPFRLLVLPTVAGLGILLSGFTTRRSADPVITTQPQDEMVSVGSTAAFAVQASNGDRYQWLRNGVALPGQTQATLAFNKLEIKDAGNYSCVVSGGAKTVASRVAALLVYARQHAGNLAATSGGAVATPMSGGNPMVVYACPILSGGSSSGCPGNYAGYVTYTLTPAQGWGWEPVSGAKSLIVGDGGGRIDTTVVYDGAYGDTSCNQTSVAVPYPAYSPVYRFAIYFPNNVPTTNYPIELTGFTTP